MAVKGIAQVKRNYRQLVKDVAEKQTNAAVYTILSQGAAISATITPIDTSNLINSQYAPQITQGKGKVSGHVGYTADYAGFVHNASGVLKGVPRPNKAHEPGRGNYWDPNAEPKFLQKGFEQIKPSIHAILKKIYKD